MAKTKCKHCEFIEKVFSQVMTNREYWIMTEIFVYLHGTDYCDHEPQVIEASTAEGKEYLMPDGTN